MKTRYHTIDIRALVKNLQGLIGLRVANIYDINHRTYLFKLAKPDHKAFLLIESGTRIHTTEFARDKSDVPSVFSLKLRKFLKTKRLESVVQLGVDRVVVFTFGSGQATQYLIVEMYAQGNIILTDGSYMIQALLRPYKISDDVVVAANHVYPIQTAKPFVALTPERVKEILASAQKKDSLKQVLAKHLDFGPELVDHCILAAKLSPDLTLENWKDENIPALLEGLQQGEKLFDDFTKENAAGYIVLREPKKQQPAKQQQQTKKSNKKDQKDNKEQKEQQEKAKEDKPQQEQGKEEQPQQGQQQQQQEQPQSQPQEEKQEEDVFDEVIPYLFLQYANRKFREFPTFDAAVDKFFSQVEVQKEEVQKNSAETAVQKKIEKFKAEHTKRITSLQQAEATNERKAYLIEANLQEVENCLIVVRSALSSGMDWGELASLVKDEKKKNPHSVANLIHRLVLDKNTVTLLLSDPMEDLDDVESDEETSDEDEEVEKERKKPNITRAPELVDVDIGISAFANARKFYELKKQSTQKAQKTVDKTEQALKAAERKSRKAMAEAKTKQGIMLARKPFWFEKFFWFISSENYLILYGRDAQQNEQLYKKYLDKDDIYVHADIHGAATCIIKNKKVTNNNGESVTGAIPPLTLSQAGTMCVCLSGAWQAKIVTSAWWVYAHQVSKTAPTGEYLTTGSFMIRGKKNFLPPSQLVVGFAFMFRLDDESTLRHQGERNKARALLAEEAAASETTQAEATAAIEDKIIQQEDQQDKEQTEKKKEEAKSEGKKGESKKGEGKQGKKGDKKENKQGDKKGEKDNKNNKKEKPAFPKEEDDGLDVDITKYKINLVAAHPGTVDEPSDDDDASTPGSTSGGGENKPTKKRISAKDRRQQKKNKDGTTTTDNDENKNEESEKNKEETTTEETKPKTELEEIKQEKGAKQPKDTNKQVKDNNNNNNNNNSNNKKGGKEKGKEATKGGKDKPQQQQQQGKKKKAKGKTKYDNDDLDEDEIQARNLLLGIKKPQAKDNKKEGKKAPENGKNPAQAKTEKKPIIKPEDLVAGSSATTSTTPVTTGESGKKEATEVESEYSQLLKEAEEGGSDSDEEREKEKEKEAIANDINLDCISGTVLDGDVLLHAIPVIAPYSVVAGFKYRVKVTPGHTKRGKAARAAQEALFRQANAPQREKDLIRAVPLEELSRAMLANAKLHAPMAVRKAAKEKAGKDIDFEVSYEDDDKK